VDERSRQLEQLRGEAAGCRACPLWERATQTVFGEGPAGARLMLVGEQPGDREDRDGHPFVGPAGRVLDEVLRRAGVTRDRVYVTNAVKHFKWTGRGPRRIHDTPNAAEVGACSPWLRREIELVDPRVLVCLGATAARAMLGRDFRLTRHRGELLAGPDDGRLITATLHPSAILRGPPEAREELMVGVVDDLRLAAAAA